MPVRITIGALARLVVLSALLSLLPGASRAAEPSAGPLLLERTIPLAGVSGRIDHLAIDLRRGGLFVAELGNGTVDAVDLTAGKVVQRVEGLPEPQGIVYIPSADMVAVANAGDGSVRLFRGEDLAPVGTVSLGEDADNVRLDRRTGWLIVGYGRGGLATLHLASQSVVSKIALPAHPEGFQLDPDAGRAYVNLPDAGQVAVVDLAAGKQVASWRVPGLSCGSGEVDVVQHETAGYRPLARLGTLPGARTSLFVPELDRLFVAARAGFLGPDASILVLWPAS